ncbi:MAG: sigma-54 dependent transcriptional regulator, partial [Spirochaetaceae bacterium]|nr:sigma-54 dependent transcriptional regulator [Spirochaetaceae bacterium]
EVLAAKTVAQGLDTASRMVVDFVLTDHHLPDGTGFDVVRSLKALNPMISVVVMTAYDDAREAVELLKAGAEDYMVKPTPPRAIERIVLRVNEKYALMHEALLPPIEGPASSPATAGIVYRSDTMARMMSIAARAADSAATVLITGESGTGKELVAQFIHDRSGRKGNFVAVNISALAESLAESELFGHRRGAFTGADSDRIGRFEEAANGTLFLDEIGDISPPLQVKLLRAIQFGVIERLGENVPRRPNVRIVAATHSDLPALVKGGSFRRDFFYRLNVIEIVLPPLRERKDDIIFLVERFIERFRERDGKKVQGITREAMDKLSKRPFPGNVRELENIIERAVVLCRGDMIRVEDLPPDESSEGGGHCGDLGSEGYEKTMSDFEKTFLSEALRQAEGNKSAAARKLGITERHLRSRIERLGMV